LVFRHNFVYDLVAAFCLAAPERTNGQAKAPEPDFSGCAGGSGLLAYGRVRLLRRARRVQAKLGII
jgi:hypothetical protein